MMKAINKVMVGTALLACTTSVMAKPSQCLMQQYDRYITASLNWYQSLVTYTVTQHPNLQDAAQHFLQERQHHFALKQAAFHDFVLHQPKYIQTDQSVESWLQLKQKDIKQLSHRTDKLGQLAKQSFLDRQHPQPSNMQSLQNAFADLLSHPQALKQPLQQYQHTIVNIEHSACKSESTILNSNKE